MNKLHIFFTIVFVIIQFFFIHSKEAEPTTKEKRQFFTTFNGPPLPPQSYLSSFLASNLFSPPLLKSIPIGFTPINKQFILRSPPPSPFGSHLPPQNFGQIGPPPAGGDKHYLPLGPIVNVVKAQSTDEQNIADQCSVSKQIQCDSNSRYRTFDGTCNNLRRPWWGSANTAHVRLLRPHYRDGKRLERRSVVDNSELPSPRLVRTTLLHDRNISGIHTRMYLEFSQLVAHDVTLNGQTQSGPAKCCSESGDRIESFKDPCTPISIPLNDRFYSQFGRQCLEYKHPTPINCSVNIESLQPAVGNSHFIDASFIYGSSDEKAQQIRSGIKGQLTVNPLSPKGYLPTTDTPVVPCADGAKNCYDAGDVRVNQNLDLAVSQNVFLRLHNYIAEKLIEVNPRWETNDDIVYQEARRIVIAIFQHITYSEWLPILIGHQYASNIGLTPSRTGYFTGYDPNLNPATLADFSGAAFRSLHSLIPPYITLVPKSGESKFKIPYSNTLQRPGDFMQDGDNYDSTIRGMLTQLQNNQDRLMTEQMTNNFIDSDVPPQGGLGKFGDDLSSKDIQRGRNYGLRPYTEYRELCGLPPVLDFFGFRDTIDPHQVAKLASVYKSAFDVDYYIGGLLEKPIFGTLTTPSFRCVLAEAFYRYKFGDRYFYDSSSNPGDFTPRQLQFIKSFSLAHALCIGGDELSSVQANVFYQASEANRLIPCPLLANIDLSSFKSVGR